jgi:hypothetical protein
MLLAPLTLDPRDGAVSIGEQPGLLFGGAQLASARAALDPFISSETSWDAYHRIECNLGPDLSHLTFGAWRCEFVSTFQDDGLVRLSWRIWPAKRTFWPAEGETNDEQMLVLRSALQAQLARPFDERFELFDWGTVGCLPDLHTNDPNARVEYRTLDRAT